MRYRPGDMVECIHTAEWQNKHRQSDLKKAAKRSPRAIHRGNAAAYMHLDEAYVVVGVTKTGGLKLRGFAIAVSPKDVRPSTKPTFR